MNKHLTAHLPLPALAIEGEGRVSSPTFGDIYFSRHDGAAETRHVFLQGNGLPERWQGRAHFTIGELGFGTGLNFMVTWEEFLRSNEGGHLHYISVEKFPLSLEQLRALHGERAWISAYPLRLPGWHRIHLERCTLTLGFGDAEALLTGAEAQVDAWFLDGFAPAKNEAMWRESLLAQVARLTAPGGSFATFTAAGAVKRALSALGFAVQKVGGFAHKREMLVGCVAPTLTPAASSFAIASEDKPRVAGQLPEEVIIIGAGIAGATVARALAERGMRVTVLEAGEVANGASGNPAAVLYPQFTKYYIPATAWHATGYGLMLRQLARWRAAGLAFTWQQPGMLRLPPRDGDAQALLQSLQPDEEIARYVTRQEASDIAGMALCGDGIYLPQGSWLVPGELCRALLRHPNIMLRTGCSMERLTRHGDGWQLHTSQGVLKAAQVVLCNAQNAAEFADVTMPMGRSAGQVTQAAAVGAPHCIISHQGYVIPTASSCLIGATYDHDDLSGAVTQANHDTNLQHARGALGAWADGLTVKSGRTSLRATTPDRLPYVGELEQELYVSAGHGSRGMISAPLAAEVIAAQMTGEMVPLTPELRQAIDPKRRVR